MVVSFNFDKYDFFFPESSNGKDWDYAQLQLTLQGKSWYKPLTLLEKGVLLEIVLHSGINKQSLGLHLDFSRTSVGHYKAITLTSCFEKFQQLGIVSDLSFPTYLLTYLRTYITNDKEKSVVHKELNKNLHTNENKEKTKEPPPAPSKKSTHRVKNVSKIQSWDELVDYGLAVSKECGFSEDFFKVTWEKIKVYDEGRPFKNRKLGVINWFKNKYTHRDWEEFKKIQKEKPLDPRDVVVVEWLQDVE